MARYAELHCHTNYSFLDGASHPHQLVDRAAELEYTALAITDHHGFYGAARFRVAAAKVGLLTVYGVEVGMPRETDGVGGWQPAADDGMRLGESGLAADERSQLLDRKGGWTDGRSQAVGGFNAAGRGPGWGRAGGFDCWVEGAGGRGPGWGRAGGFETRPGAADAWVEAGCGAANRPSGVVGAQSGGVRRGLALGDEGAVQRREESAGVRL